MASPRKLIGALLLGLMSQHALAKCDTIKPVADAQGAGGVDFKVLLNDLNGPRGVIMDSEGHLLVVEGGKGIRRVVLDGGDALDVCVSSSDQIVDNESLNHGIALSSDGKTLFASSISDAYAYSYDAKNGTVGKAKNIITGMNKSGHETRTLYIPPHNSGMLLVSHGSNANIDNATTDIKTARSQIRIFKIDDLMSGNDAVQYSSGEVLGWGLRNSVGIAEDPTNGNIWSVENSIDEMHRDGTDIHNTDPGEEMNFHGNPNDTNSDVYGKNFGYPACVSIWDTDNVKNYPGGAAIGKQMRGDQMPSNYTDQWCQDNALAPYNTFGPHQAPLDIKFRKDGSAAYISFHGSWNRDPPNGYRVSCVQFSDKGFPEAGRDSPNAETQILWNKDNSKCADHGCFRPVGLVVDDASGRIYMTSDDSNELYVLTGALKDGICAPSKKQNERDDSSKSSAAMLAGWSMMWSVAMAAVTMSWTWL